MTDPTMHLLEYLGKFGLEIDSDFLREGLRVLIQSVIEAEVTGNRRLHSIGAEPYERSPERTNQRNGYRDRPYATRLGELELHIPKLPCPAVGWAWGATSPPSWSPAARRSRRS